MRKAAKLLIFFAMTWCMSASAQPITFTSIVQVEQNLRSFLTQTEIALTALSDLFDAGGFEEEAIGHATFKRYLALTPGLRALILLDHNGKLTVDSYKYPSAGIDLSDRVYFKRAQAAENDGLIFTPPVVGRTSGAPFVPIAHPTLLGRGGLKHVVVGVTTPEVLIPRPGCSDCVVAVWLIEPDGWVPLSTYPANSNVPENLLTALQSAPGDRGTIETDFHALKAHTDFVKLDRWPIAVSFSKVFGG